MLNTMVWSWMPQNAPVLQLSNEPFFKNNFWSSVNFLVPTCFNQHLTWRVRLYSGLQLVCRELFFAFPGTFFTTRFSGISRLCFANQHFTCRVRLVRGLQSFRRKLCFAVSIFFWPTWLSTKQKSTSLGRLSKKNRPERRDTLKKEEKQDPQIVHKKKRHPRAAPLARLF